MSHTKGKLEITPDVRWIIGEDGNRVATASMPSRDDDVNCANARRLVACWNACDGVKTESLEDNDDIHQPVRTLAKANQLLRDDRDELVKALREITFSARTSGGTAGRDEHLVSCCEKAEAILARYPDRKS